MAKNKKNIFGYFPTFAGFKMYFKTPIEIILYLRDLRNKVTKHFVMIIGKNNFVTLLYVTLSRIRWKPWFKENGENIIERQTNIFVRKSTSTQNWNPSNQRLQSIQKQKVTKKNSEANIKLHIKVRIGDFN
jgi:hypothetical protein